MKQWTTDARIESDTRYPWIVRRAFAAGAPMWLIDFLTRVSR